MARLFPKGSKIVAAKEGTALPGLRTMASTWRSGSTDHISVMVVNDADASRTMTIRVPGAGRRAVVVYRYFDNDRPVDKEGYPVPSATLRKANLAKGVKLEMPSRGVVFLTTRKD